MSNLIESAKNYLSEKVASVKKPEATVTDVDLDGVGIGGITYAAKVSVSNPYSVAIPICQISYTLKSGGRVIASGTIPDPGSLAGSETTLLNVPVKVPHNVLVSLGKDIGADWDIDYELEIGLTIDLPLIGEFTIPLSTMGEIKLPSLSDWWKGE